MPNSIRGIALHSHLQPPKIGIGKPLRWIVSQQILGSQFIADLTKGIIQLRNRTGVVIFAAGIARNLNQSVFPSRVAAGAGFDRYYDDAVNDSFGLYGGPDGFFVIGFADRIATVGDDHQDFSSLPLVEGPRREEKGIVKSRRRSVADTVNAAIDAAKVRSERHYFVDGLTELV